MIKRYKGYKIVDAQGLKGLMKSKDIKDDGDFLRFMQEENILYINKGKKEPEYVMSAKYSDFLKENKRNKGRSKARRVYVVTWYANICYVELLDDKEKINVVKESVQNVICEVMLGKMYITNPEALKESKWFDNAFEK